MREYYIGDAMKLKQVLLNILGNAVKFTPEEGSIRFEIEEGPRFDSQATVRFIISDVSERSWKNTLRLSR